MAQTNDSPAVVVLVATRKGAWLFHGDGDRSGWRADGPHFLGHIIHHMVLDPRDGRTLLAAAKTGHLGPTIFRSTDLGRTWKEAARPPAFAKANRPATAGRRRPHLLAHPLPCQRAGRLVCRHLAPGPVPLRRRGRHLGALLLHINDDPQYREWMGTVQDGTPDGPKLHSIIVDPRDPAHLYFAMSGGGVHESVDGGEPSRRWSRGWRWSRASTRRTDLPRSALRAHVPEHPDRLYQQNHCGIYRSTDPATMEAHRQGDARTRSATSAFRMVVHPRDPDTAWVLPHGRTQTSGHAPAPAAGPPSTSPATGQALAATGRRPCPRRRRGGPSSARRWPRTAGPGRPVLRHHQRRAVDER
jgi:hypothetical protein